MSWNENSAKPVFSSFHVCRGVFWKVASTALTGPREFSQSCLSSAVGGVGRFGWLFLDSEGCR
jgi:hypothetical protein